MVLYAGAFLTFGVGEAAHAAHARHLLKGRGGGSRGRGSGLRGGGGGGGGDGHLSTIEIILIVLVCIMALISIIYGLYRCVQKPADADPPEKEEEPAAQTEPPVPSNPYADAPVASGNAGGDVVTGYPHLVAGNEGYPAYMSPGPALPAAAQQPPPSYGV